MRSLAAGFVVALAALQLAPGAGTIAGIVIKAGTAIQQPLSNARLELSGGGGPVLITRTATNGGFVFSNLAQGEYRLAVTRDGFIRQELSKKIILGRGQQIQNIRFELDPAPTVTGRVLDSFGEAVSNIMVEALGRTYDVRGNPRFARAATAVTDDLGDYRIFWLDTGEYFFYAASAPSDPSEPEPTRVFEPTYSPGVSTPDDAKSLRLDIGREVHVDFRMSRRVALWTVSGQTMSALTGRSVGASITLTPPAEDPSFSRYHAQSSATGPYPGQFSMENVLPGSYIMIAKSGSGDREITSIQRIVLRPIPYAPVRPPDYNSTFTLSPPFSLNGRLFVESRESIDLHEAAVTLLSVDPDFPPPRSAPARPEGQFTLNGVVPASYVLEISNLPQDLYLKAARFGDADILDKPLIVDTRSAATPLQILLGSDGGRLRVADLQLPMKRSNAR